MSDIIHERGKSLEEAFFRHRDQQLLEKLRAELETKNAVESLRAATGITDENTLRELAEQKVTAESMTGLSMVPLVVVAWADEKITPAERDALLKAAHESGIEEGTPAYQLFEAWLDHKPDHELFEAWKHYVAALKEKLDPAAFHQMTAAIMDRAKRVAKASGGLLGTSIGSISVYEEKKLNELRNTLGIED